jgi:hypothetical protein
LISFGGLLADEQLVLGLDVADDRLVHLVAADAQRLRDDDPAEADHSDLGGAAADVHDHVPGRLGDGRPAPIAAAIGSSIRYAWRAPALSVASSTRASRPGHAGRDADDDARVREPVLVHLLDEVAQHLLGHVEVCDHAVLQRADRGNRPGSPPEHALCLDADRMHLARALVDRDHARLGEHDAAAAHVDERVRGSEVDGHVAATEAVEVTPETHDPGRV